MRVLAPLGLVTLVFVAAFGQLPEFAAAVIDICRCRQTAASFWEDVLYPFTACFACFFRTCSFEVFRSLAIFCRETLEQILHVHVPVRTPKRQFQTPKRQFQTPKDNSRHQMTIPDTQKTIPDTQKIIPDTQKTIPETQKTTPDAQKTIPDTQLTNPSTQQTIPSTQLTHPATSLQKI